jgi:ring-1,2-phenylacetyl-CoA epoxidase subunit PaaC
VRFPSPLAGRVAERSEAGWGTFPTRLGPSVLATLPCGEGKRRQKQVSTQPPLFIYTLRLADNALVLGHRLSEWCGHAPVLEEDLALGNLALDLIGQARSLYGYAGEIEGRGRDEDFFAYLRDAGEYRNILLVEQPNGDFAATIVRQLLYAAYAHPYFEALANSADATLAAIAAKSAKELAYHLRHAGEWTIRLGDGTEESHERTQAALDDLWRFTGEMFEADEIELPLIESGVAVDPEKIRPRWERSLAGILAEANLQRPREDWMQSGGRAGRHSEHLGYILAELQFLQRVYPGARW